MRISTHYLIRFIWFALFSLNGCWNTQYTNVCSQIISKLEVSGLNQEVLLQSLLFSAMPLIDNQHNIPIIEFYHFYILGKIEICPTAQNIHDNKLHSSKYYSLTLWCLWFLIATTMHFSCLFFTSSNERPQFSSSLP